MFTCKRPRARSLTIAIVPAAVVCLTVMLSGQTGEHAGHDMAKMPAAKPPKGAKVFFVEPKKGATVSSPVHFVFGSEKLTIAAVPEGEVTMPRPNTGHYHLGVDTDCMSPNQVIPKGTPSWVHFGKGDNKIDMQLTPGRHKFALQLGDDKHQTLPGLCQTISITVK